MDGEKKTYLCHGEGSGSFMSINEHITAWIVFYSYGVIELNGWIVLRKPIPDEFQFVCSNQFMKRQQNKGAHEYFEIVSKSI